MNKKGAVMHWIMLGVLIAIAVFFIAAKKPLTTEIKGEWSADFLKDNYLEAEKEILTEEIVLRNVGMEVAKELAENGGLSKDIISECETIDNINLWNSKDKWCLPNVSKNVNEEVIIKLKTRIQEAKFSEAGFNDSILFAKGEKKEITSKAGKYIYDTSAGVDLGYSFEEYEKLKSEAEKLVSICKNKKKLIECLENNKPTYWKLGSCEQGEEVYTPNIRKIVFCVESPTNYYLVSHVSFLLVWELVKYKLALDFAPTNVFPIENLMVVSENDEYKITFDQDEMATAYKIYYTDWDVTNHIPNDVGSVFRDLPKDRALRVYETILISDANNLKCEEKKEFNKAYLCNGKILYNLADAKIKKERIYFLMVTTIVKDTESDIGSFAELK